MTGVLLLDNKLVLYENNCCDGLRGDYNGDGNIADVMDLTFVVDFIFRGSGDHGACRVAIDVNGDGLTIPNILDLTYIVDYLFRNGPPPVPC